MIGVARIAGVVRAFGKVGKQCSTPLQSLVASRLVPVVLCLAIKVMMLGWDLYGRETSSLAILTETSSLALLKQACILVKIMLSVGVGARLVVRSGLI